MFLYLILISLVVITNAHYTTLIKEDLWSSHEIPYFFDLDESNNDTFIKAVAKDGLGWINSNFPRSLRFQEIEDPTYINNYIKFRHTNLFGRCGSVMRSDNVVEVNLKGPPCGLFDTVHEIMHALGFSRHEHQRYDRDFYITINFSNIKKEFLKDAKYNFEICHNCMSVDHFSWAYDWCSIMHYGRFLDNWAINKSVPIIEPKDKNKASCMGNTFFSELDRLRFLYLYGPLITDDRCYEDVREAISCSRT